MIQRTCAALHAPHQTGLLQTLPHKVWFLRCQRRWIWGRPWTEHCNTQTWLIQVASTCIHSNKSTNSQFDDSDDWLHHWWCRSLLIPLFHFYLIGFWSIHWAHDGHLCESLHLIHTMTNTSNTTVAAVHSHVHGAVPHSGNGSNRLDHMADHIDNGEVDDGPVGSKDCDYVHSELRCCYYTSVCVYVWSEWFISTKSCCCLDKAPRLTGTSHTGTNHKFPLLMIERLVILGAIQSILGWRRRGLTWIFRARSQRW